MSRLGHAPPGVYSDDGRQLLGLENDAGLIAPLVLQQPFSLAALLSLPTGELVLGQSAFVSDVGVSGCVAMWSGARWIIPPCVLGADNAGYVLPGYPAACSASQAGSTVTVTTAAAHNIPATLHDGAMVFYPGPTGAGWYPGFVRTGTSTFTFTNTGAAINDGAVTAHSNSEVTLPTFGGSGLLVPGGAMGSNGTIKSDGIAICNNSAGAKTLRHKAAGVVYALSNLTTSVSVPFSAVLQNFNSQSVQKIFAAASGNSSAYGAGGLAANGGACSLGAVNTAVSFALTHTLQIAAASDYAALHTSNFNLQSVR